MSDVRGVLPGPGSNTAISMPRIFWYHCAERATSATLITRWSSALTLIDMTYPFVAADAHLPHWPYHSLFVTTPPIVNSTDTNRASDSGQGRNCMTSRRTAIGLIAI